MFFSKFSAKFSTGRRLAWLLFCFCWVLYLFLFSGFRLSTDELALFSGAQSLSLRGTLSATALYWNDHGTVVFGAPGHAYPSFEAGQMILAAPLHVIARLFARFWPGVGMLPAVWLFNTIVTALSCSLLFRVGRALRYSLAASMLLALIFATATIALPYARTFFREPLSGFALLLAFYTLLCLPSLPAWRSGWMLGGALALAYLSKVSNIVALPVFLIAACWILFVEAACSRRSVNDPKSVDDPKTGGYKPPLRRRVVPLLIVLAMLGLAMIALQGSNLLQDSGGTMASNARSAAAFVPQHLQVDWSMLWRNVRGYLFSPGMSVFLYSPPTLLSVLAFPHFLRQRRATALFCLALCTVYLLGYAYTKGEFWFGGLNWGPRFLVPITPFLLMPSLPLIEWVVGKNLPGRLDSTTTSADVPFPKGIAVGARGVSLLALIITTGAGLTVQALSILSPLLNYAAQMGQLRSDAMWTLAIYDWRYTPFVYGWHLITPQNIDLFWLRHLRADGGVDWLPVLMAVPALCWIAWQIYQQKPNRSSCHLDFGELRLRRAQTSASSVESSSRRVVESSSRRVVESSSRRAVILSCFLPLLLTAVLLRDSVHDPRLPGGEDRLALSARLNEQSRPDDAIVLSDATQTEFYLNTLRSRAPFYAIDQQSNQIGEKELALFAALHNSHERIWLISDDSLAVLPQPWNTARPDEAWWTVHAARLHEEQFSPYARLSLFIKPPEQLENFTINAIFSDTIHLEQLQRTQQKEQKGEKEWLYLQLAWKSEAQLKRDYTVFWQLLDGSGALVWQLDQQPQHGFAPTSTWLPQKIVNDAIAIPINQLPVGVYRLILGLYFFDAQGQVQRLPVLSPNLSGVEAGKDYIELGKLEVVAN